jgi:hypothetical protein
MNSDRAESAAHDERIHLVTIDWKRGSLEVVWQKTSYRLVGRAS